VPRWNHRNHAAAGCTNSVSGYPPANLSNIAVTAGLLLTTIMAYYIPARKAARVDPIIALRQA
jgi:ABC-type antimicrobial peptide transport system permease subunit